MHRATFGAGCYWGTERYFKKQFKSAIVEGAVGFMGGEGTENPGYRAVCTGKTGHAEVYSFQYDPKEVQYPQLVEFFFRMHNPTTTNRQGNDVGTQYRSVIFYHDDEQLQVAKEYIQKLNSGSDGELKAKFEKAFGGGSVVTTLEPASTFFPAQEDHQQYLERNPGGYCNHRVYY